MKHNEMKIKGPLTRSEIRKKVVELQDCIRSRKMRDDYIMSLNPKTALAVDLDKFSHFHETTYYCDSCCAYVEKVVTFSERPGPSSVCLSCLKKAIKLFTT